LAVNNNAFGQKERKKATQPTGYVAGATAMILDHGCILLYQSHQYRLLDTIRSLVQVRQHGSTAISQDRGGILEVESNYASTMLTANMRCLGLYITYNEYIDIIYCVEGHTANAQSHGWLDRLDDCLNAMHKRSG
jgi:hypothetical protein